ncbi:MAG: creatininase family protein, partial [Candidatus Aminicenantes bacterium]|nr:creatininase family protein [Candidatus Aminicenantes bacterium]
MGDLSALICFDRLEVGPPRLRADRLEAEYRVFAFKGDSEATSMIFRFEEAVFDPSNPVDQNMAAVMAAQVAVNYGLFCRSMVFFGNYDRKDARFLRQMTENTAREIMVKKFLQPNPFLIPPWDEVDVAPRKTYSQAALQFPDATEAENKKERKPWIVDNESYLVLSSGGKDSLLSFGLLRELEQEVHPVFVNESGRHWFTALNAYRYFRSSIPQTARVWVNSDRVFAWMLRRMPGIRKDFAAVRADDYPIRLWTVAVFLFSTLPLARKRGIGRIVVGDEYDTTIRAVHQGIPHYDGLYDQSHFFDAALTRYFQDKGWGLEQFSLLRPLSEILIQKTLAQRYPALLAQQVSCHAALQGEDGRVRPCGRCEKCRRIIGMLTALGIDSSQLGYRTEQVERALKELVSR